LFCFFEISQSTVAFYNLVLGFCLFCRHAMSQYVAPIVLSDLEIFMTLFLGFLKSFHAAC
jgi:hypothetical protein